MSSVNPSQPSETQALVADLRRRAAETPDVEVKSAVGGTPRSARETLSAFSNDHGGVLLLGMSDPAQGLEPVAGFDADAISDGIAGMMANDIEPPVRGDVAIELVDGTHRIVRVDVPEGDPSSKPFFVKTQGRYGGSYIRGADGDRTLTNYEVDRLLENHAQPSFDREILTAATARDLDAPAIATYLARLRQRRPSAFGRRSDEDVLLMTGVLGMTPDDGTPHPTLAGLLVFGSYPQQFFPQLFISVVALPATEMGVPDPQGQRFLDNQQCEGSLPEACADAVAVLARNMTRASVIASDIATRTGRIDRYEYPLDVLRELIVNAVMHRDYSPEGRRSQVQVELYPDRLVVRSPGGFFGAVTPEELGAPNVSSSRNELLAKLLADAPLPNTLEMMAENRGSGIPTVFHSLSSAGMEPPVFDVRPARVEVIIPHSALLTPDTLHWIEGLGQEGLSTQQVQALAVLRRGRELSNQTMRARGLHADEATCELGDLVRRGLAVRVGSRRWTTYRLASGIPIETSTHARDAAAGGPRHGQLPAPADWAPSAAVEPKARHTGSQREEEILRLLHEHGVLTSAQLENLLGVKRTAIVRYLNALTASGEVFPTAPPRSPLRAYRLTR